MASSVSWRGGEMATQQLAGGGVSAMNGSAALAQRHLETISAAVAYGENIWRGENICGIERRSGGARKKKRNISRRRRICRKL